MKHAISTKSEDTPQGHAYKKSEIQNNLEENSRNQNKRSEKAIQVIQEIDWMQKKQN